MSGDGTRRARPFSGSGAVLLGLRRRAAADSWPLLASSLVLVLSVVLADATPRLLTRVADQTVHAAIAAQPSADVIVTAPFTQDVIQADRDAGTAERVRTDAAQLESALPGALATVLRPPTGLVSSTELPAATPDGPALLRMAYPWRDGFAGVDWVAGRAPEASEGGRQDDADNPRWPVQVGLSAPVATLLGARPGDRLQVSSPDRQPLDVTVSGVFTAREPDDPLWGQVPGMLDPVTRGAGAGRTTVVGALLSEASLPDVRLALDPQAVSRTYTFAVRPDALRFDSLGAVARSASALEAAPGTLGLTGPAPRVWTQLDTVARTLQARVQAAASQASVLLVGVLGAAVAVLFLAAWLLVRRRAVVLGTYRARGASAAGVGLALAAEQVLLCLLAGVIGLVVGHAVAPGRPSWSWVLPVLALTALGLPALGFGSTVERRAAPGPAARRSSEQARTVRRLATELTLLLTVAAALAALRRRGLPSEPGGADLLLVGAPTLAALTVGILGSRLAALLHRGAVRITARLRRAGPVLATAGGAAAHEMVAPFAVLTMCTALATFGVVVGSTLTAGQVAGSWDTVGADVLVRADADHPLDALAQQLAGAPGVDAVTLGRLEQNVQVFGLPRTERVDVLAVDSARYARLLEAAPLRQVTGLDGLTSEAGPGTPLPILAGSDLRAAGTAASLLWDGRTIPLRAVGEAPDLSPALAGTAPRAELVVVDSGALAAAAGGAVEADVLWAVGPGAEAAVSRAGPVAGTVTGRSAWLAERRHEPLTAGLLLLLRAGFPLLTGLAGAVVVLAAAAGATRRARTIAVLRVLGLDRRQVSHVVVGEAVPWALLAGAVGIATGGGLAAATLGPLRLRLVTGQAADPGLEAQWWLLLLPLALGLVAGAVALLQLSRRSPLGQTMRIGG